MPGDTALEYAVHPLVLLNISDHFNRNRIQHPQTPAVVCGALLGTQGGRHVEVVTSFEVKLAHDAASGAWTLSSDLFSARLGQFKEVFPECDFLGWYSTSSQPPGALELTVHRQFMAFNELPIYARLDPLLLARASAATAADDTGAPAATAAAAPLPLVVYEAALDPNSGDVAFVEAPVRLETGEAERIAVEGVAKGSSAGDGPDASIVSHLSGQRSALEMLQVRVKALLAYVEAAQAGVAPVDHALLRQIASVAHQLPSMAGADFEEQFAQEYNEVLLALYLAVLTKNTQITNDMVDRHLELHPASSGGERGAGGFFGPAVGGRKGRAFGGSIGRSFGMH